MQIAAKVVTVPFALLLTGRGAAKTGLTTLGKGVGTVVGMHRRPCNTPTALPLLAGSFSGHGYAKDDIGFCTAAQASACIYAPADTYAVYD